MCVFSGGGGAPVVLVHGAGDQAGGWAKVAPRLAKSFAVVVVDLAGHGESAPASGSIPFATLLAGFDGAMKEIPQGKVTLVGNSLGAWVATLWAKDHPDRVQHLVLVNGGPLLGDRPDLTLHPKNRAEADRTLAATRMMSSTTKSGTIGADGSRSAASVLSASARFLGWRVRSGRSPRSGPPFTRTRCWTLSGWSFAHKVATHAPSEFPTSVTLPCGISFIAPSNPARSVAKGIEPEAGALSPCPARSTTTTAKLFARRGATFAQPPAWSPAPCRRTTGAPPPPEKTHMVMDKWGYT